MRELLESVCGAEQFLEFGIFQIKYLRNILYKTCKFHFHKIITFFFAITNFFISVKCTFSFAFIAFLLFKNLISYGRLLKIFEGHILNLIRSILDMVGS